MALPILDGNQTATTLSTVLTSGEHIPAHTVVSLGSVAISNITSAVSGSVVSVSNFPSTQTISGTVTANLDPSIQNEVANGINQYANSYDTPFPISLPAGVTSLPISGTVTANAGNFGFDENQSLTVGGEKGILVGWYDDASGEYRRAGDATPLPISGTVTVGAMPNGALTTRFGSVTTANTAQITSAVTNTSRKYLLAQNISAGTVTIGIGFSPTTTQGIQLTAGGGLTFDAFCPTGAVYWLGAVTGANYCLIEG